MVENLQKRLFITHNTLSSDFINLAQETRMQLQSRFEINKANSFVLNKLLCELILLVFTLSNTRINTVELCSFTALYHIQQFSVEKRT